MDLIKVFKNSNALYFTKKFDEAFNYIDKEVKWWQPFLVYSLFVFILSLVYLIYRYIQLTIVFLNYDASDNLVFEIFGGLIGSIILIFLIICVVHYLTKFFFDQSRTLKDSLKFGNSLLIFPIYFNSIIILFIFLLKGFDGSQTVGSLVAKIYIFAYYFVLILTLIVSIKTFKKLYVLSLMDLVRLMSNIKEIYSKSDLWNIIKNSFIIYFGKNDGDAINYIRDRTTWKQVLLVNFLILFSIIVFIEFRWVSHFFTFFDFRVLKGIFFYFLGPYFIALFLISFILNFILNKLGGTLEYSQALKFYSIIGYSVLLFCLITPYIIFIGMWTVGIILSLVFIFIFFMLLSKFISGVLSKVYNFSRKKVFLSFLIVGLILLLGYIFIIFKLIAQAF